MLNAKVINIAMINEVQANTCVRTADRPGSWGTVYKYDRLVYLFARLSYNRVRQ